MQADGNLVALNGADQPYWDSRTEGRPGSLLTMQEDGNLVVHNEDGAVGWSTWTMGHPGAFLIVQDDGNVVLMSTDGTALWNVWQDNDDRGTSLGKTLGQIAGSLEGVAAFAHDAVKVLRIALPAVTAILAASGVGLPISAALAAGGAEIIAIDEAASRIYEAIKAGEQGIAAAESLGKGPEGFAAAVAVLNDNISAADIAEARASLTTDDDRAAFDLALQNAGDLAGTDAARQAAATIVAQEQAAFRAHLLGTPLTPQQIRNLLAGPALTPQQVGGLLAAPPPAPPLTSDPTNIIAILAKAKGVTPAQYVASVRAAAASPKPAAPPRAPSSSSSSAVALVAIGVAALLFLRR
jgi:hypothetical protein